MVPKIIHYCWFGKGLMPKSQKDCIKGWKKLMPDYQIMCWDESNFDVGFCPYTKESYEKKKYAFVADVARLVALSEYGGIYLDTDVEVFQRFDRFLDFDFFTGVELYREFELEHIAEKYLYEDGTPKEEDVDVPHLEVLTSSMGCCPHSPIIHEVLDYYKNIVINDDILNDFRRYVNFDRLMARHLTHYGFKYKNETQYLGKKMIVFCTGVFGHAFCPDERYEVSWHYNTASWIDVKKKNNMIKKFFKCLGMERLYNNAKSLLLRKNS